MPAMSRVVLSVIPFTGFDRGILDGIARYAQLHGPWVFYLSGDYPELPLPAPDSLSGVFQWPGCGSRAGTGLSFPDLRRWKAEGIIARIQSPRIARRILASGLPVIAIDLSAEQLQPDNPLSRISEVRADSRQAGRLGAEHFLARGFRHFAFCGYSGRIWSQHRQEGFADRLLQSGYKCDVFEPPPHRRSLSWKWEQPLVAAWLRTLAKPAAVMACSDIRGRQVIEAALTQGLAVPDDIAVLGVDDDQLVCNLTNPPLSSVAFGLERAGYRAAELLDNLMAGRVKGPRRIDVEALWVVPRRSTDVVATDDRHLGAALRFIRDNARRAINVGDVTAATGLSRRSLEIRFRRALGRSIHSEIQRARLTFAKQLLLETDLPAARIAALTGFANLQYFSTVFRRETGATISSFRRQLRTP